MPLTLWKILHGRIIWSAHGKLSQEFHVHIHQIISMCSWTWNSIVHQPVISNGLSVFLGSCKLAADHNLASCCQTTGTCHNLANTGLIWHPMEKILVILRHHVRSSLIMHTTTTTAGSPQNIPGWTWGTDSFDLMWQWRQQHAPICGMNGKFLIQWFACEDCWALSTLLYSLAHHRI